MDVVAVLPDATLRARLVGALRGREAVVRFCATVGEARAALAAGVTRALVVGAYDAERLPTAPLVEQVRREHPQVTVVAYCALARGEHGASTAFVELVRAGVHTVFMRDIDDDPHALRTALRLAEQACAAALVLDAVASELPPGVRPLVALYLRSDARPLEVGEAARALGVHRRTLVNRMRAAGCPPPRALRTWCRVFVAAHLLEGTGRTVESIAHQLDFETPSGLRNTLRRYTGHAPAALRTAGGLRCALHAFVAACAVRRDATRRVPRPPAPAPTSGGAPVPPPTGAPPRSAHAPAGRPTRGRARTAA